MSVIKELPVMTSSMLVDLRNLLNIMQNKYFQKDYRTLISKLRNDIKEYRDSRWSEDTIRGIFYVNDFTNTAVDIDKVIAFARRKFHEEEYFVAKDLHDVLNAVQKYVDDIFSWRADPRVKRVLYEAQPLFNTVEATYEDLFEIIRANPLRTLIWFLVFALYFVVQTFRDAEPIDSPASYHYSAMLFYGWLAVLFAITKIVGTNVVLDGIGGVMLQVCVVVVAYQGSMYAAYSSMGSALESIPGWSFALTVGASAVGLFVLSLLQNFGQGQAAGYTYGREEANLL